MFPHLASQWRLSRNIGSTDAFHAKAPKNCREKGIRRNVNDEVDNRLISSFESIGYNIYTKLPRAN
jgi:hypothetical protein